MVLDDALARFVETDFFNDAFGDGLFDAVKEDSEDLVEIVLLTLSW